jgi:hypothetical protein
MLADNLLHMWGDKRLHGAVSAGMVSIAVVAINVLSLVVRHYNLYK